MPKQELHPTSGYSRIEEWANSITHGIGAALSIAGLVVAVVFASMNGDPYLITACSVYGTTLILVHLASTLYHSFRGQRWKGIFLTLDHSAIYLMIAGTYTPFCLGPLRGPVGWSIFGIIWGLAAMGVVREIFRTKQAGLFSTGIYLAMGWLVVAFLFPLARSVSTGCLLLLLMGGILYSAGVGFYLWRSLRFHHAVWHLFVMAGAATQYFAILSLVS